MQLKRGITGIYKERKAVEVDSASLALIVAVDSSSSSGVLLLWASEGIAKVVGFGSYLNFFNPA